MSKDYKCPLCGKNHTIYFGIKAPLNAEMQNLVDSKSDRIIEHYGMYMMDKERVIFPGVIEIPSQHEENFFYETWISFEINAFIEMSENMSKTETSELQGELVDDLIPYYYNTKGLKALAVFNPKSSSEERVQFKIVQESEIKKDQQTGISNERLIELINRLHHWKDKKIAYGFKCLTR